MKKILSLLSIVLIISLVSCKDTIEFEIVTTNFIAYDFTKQIVGDKLSVKLIIPPGYDYHDYEPTSNDLFTIRKSDVFIYLSANHDSWITGSNLLTKENNIQLINLVNDLEELNLSGNHFWTNPNLAAEIIKNLSLELADIYEEFAELFILNGNTYANSILNIASEFKEDLEDIEVEPIYVVGHNAFLGFEYYFNIEIIALEESINPEVDSTSNQVINFINELKENQVKYLFHDEEKDLNTINGILSRVSGLILLELHAYHHLSLEDANNNVSYYDLLSRNINHLKEAIYE